MSDVQELPWPYGPQGWSGVPGFTIHSRSICFGREGGRSPRLWCLSFVNWNQSMFMFNGIIMCSIIQCLTCKYNVDDVNSVQLMCMWQVSQLLCTCCC